MHVFGVTKRADGSVVVFLTFAEPAGAASVAFQYSTDQDTWVDAEPDRPVTSTTSYLNIRLPDRASGLYYFRIIVEEGKRAGVSNVASGNI